MLGFFFPFFFGFNEVVPIVVGLNHYYAMLICLRTGDTNEIITNHRPSLVVVGSNHYSIIQRPPCKRTYGTTFASDCELESQLGHDKKFTLTTPY
jgi:hypothetical protein